MIHTLRMLASRLAVVRFLRQLQEDFSRLTPAGRSSSRSKPGFDDGAATDARTSLPGGLATSTSLAAGGRGPRRRPAAAPASAIRARRRGDPDASAVRRRPAAPAGCRACPRPRCVPWLMISTRSQICCASDRMCVDSRTVRSRPSSWMMRRTSMICAGSRPMVGSSRIRTSGWCSSACASPTRCRSPLDRLPMKLSERSDQVDLLEDLVDALVQIRHPAQRAHVRPGTRRPSSRDRAAPSQADSRPGGGPPAIARRRRSRPRWPVPLVGGMKPVRMRIVVVLPAPFGPRNPRISPGGH